MDLEAIKNPLFLKNLTDEELRNVCEDIRNYIIDFTSANGGYLSGNLSSVEISVMMNKCFNTEDFLIFDGNDINYTEKILNGRINELQMNSNGAYSLANALGVATARDLEHKDYHVVAVVNSTDLLSGRNIETLNLISSSGRKLIIVFNDDTTIDRGIGMIDRLIASVRKTRSYNNLKDNVKDMIRPSKNGEKIIENIHNLKTNLKKTMIDEGVFSEFNIDYIGPINGHDLNELERAFEIAKDKDYPCVIHCLTTKGKGFKYAEACTNDIWNKVSSFNKETGTLLVGENNEMRYGRNILGSLIEELMAENRDLVCVTTRNINDYGVANVFAKYPQRSFDTSSSAENSLSFASGMALNGKIPFLVFKAFELPNAYKMLRNQIGKLHKPLIIGLLDDGNLNYDLLNMLNGIYVVDPEDTVQLRDVAYSAQSADEPTVIICQDKLLKNEKNTNFKTLELGKWQISVNNDMKDAVILGSGEQLKQIKEIIEANNLPYDLINTLCINPIDKLMADKLIQSNKKIYVYGHKSEILLLKYFNANSFTDRLIFMDDDGVDKLFAAIQQ